MIHFNDSQVFDSKSEKEVLNPQEQGFPSKMLMQTEQMECNYRLKAVVGYIAEKQHYVAFCRYSGKWY